MVQLEESALVTGLIIGNHRTEMLVFSERETISEQKEVVTERYETLQLGIALRSSALLDLGPFAVLKGQTIRQHLAQHRPLEAKGAA